MVDMHVSMNVCLNISMYINGIYVCMYLSILVCTYVCTVCMYVSMNVCDVLTWKLIPSVWRFRLSVPVFVRMLMCVNKEVCMHACL